MRLVVTGAAGFIGTNFVRHALARSADAVSRLVAVDLLTYAGNYANLADLEADPRFRFVRADIADRDAMATLVDEEAVDTLVNCAAETHVDRSIADHSPFVTTNVEGTLVLLEAARQRTGFRRFLQVSTDEVYGSISAGRATEDWPTRPSSPYAASKAAADAFVQAYATTYGLPAIITRCSNNYGPYQFPEKLIPLFVTNALDGEALPLYGDGEGRVARRPRAEVPGPAARQQSGAALMGAAGPARPEHVPEPWGHETIWEGPERYAGKIDHVRKGESLSYQYHRVKDETIHV